ncbi:MAG: serine/threonine phosphatase [Chloroflexaceae bacterium]|nr:serine/threonine phosphatase [Chloroflexaceae bacterium]
MLICPQCQFENAAAAPNCDRCGTSLTHKNCPECGTQAPLSVPDCPNCGAFIGTIWRALILHSPELAGTSPSEATAQWQLQLQDSLDADGRYQLLSLEATPPVSGDAPSQLPWQGRVLDRQPLAKTRLSLFLEAQAEPLTPSTDSLQTLPPTFDLPESALNYLALQDLPAIPEIGDAWQDAARTVLLLADRSQWQPLEEFLAAESLPLLQLLYYFDEMLQLWEALTKVNCRRSLLALENLRVDEDQYLVLLQLYPDSGGVTSLAQLGQLWLELLGERHSPDSQLLRPFLQRVSNGQFDHVAQVRSQLQQLARTQATEPETPREVVNPPEEDSTNFLTTREDSEGDELPTVVLPMELLSLAEAGITDIGSQRAQNEDFYGIETQISRWENSRRQKIQVSGLFIVCDGMGGHAGGEVASALAVETLQRYFQSCRQENLPSEETIIEGILQANQAIYDENLKESRSGVGRMGTTIALALVHNTHVAIAHVGDSRIYRVTRRRGSELLTLDHAVGQREIMRGVEREVAYARPDAYQLTQALGPRNNGYVKPDVQFFEVNEDTLLLLCSDGLSDNQLLEQHGDTYLVPLLSSRANLEQGLRKMIEFANEQNGHDNLSAIAIRLKVQPSLEHQPLF